MPILGEFAQGPIQFGAGGAIERRGTIDRSQPSVTQERTVAQAAPPGTGGVLPEGGFDFSGAVPEPVDLRPSTMPPPNDNAWNDTLPESMRRDDFSMPKRGFEHPKLGGPIGRRGGANGINGPSPFSNGLNGFGAGSTFDGGLGAGFEDGGEVPEYEDGAVGAQQGADAATLDPMGMFRTVLQNGRRSMGLPADFNRGPDEAPQAQAFDDGGGVLPMEEDVTGAVTGGEGNPNAVNPEDTLRYLTGDGAVSPEVAQALEANIDPDGSMSPAERTMSAIEKAPEEAKFAMMQHYRGQFNGLSGGARAAIDKGDLGQAAMNATEAFANVPTGKDIQFAPAGQGRIAVMVSGLKRLMGAGLLGKAPVHAGEDAWNQFHGSGPQSLDDGGGVLPMEDEEEDEGGLIPGGTEQVLADHAAEGEALDAEPQQPVILTAEQFKRLLTSYDHPIENGWDDALQSALANGLQSSAMAAPDRPMEPGMSDGPTPEQPMGAQPVEGPDAMAGHAAIPQSPATKEGHHLAPQEASIPDPAVAAAAGAAAQPAAPAAPAAPQEPYAAAKDGLMARAARANQPQVADRRPAAPPVPMQNQREPQPLRPGRQEDSPEMQADQALFERAQKLANQIFPWSSQQEQRQNYIDRFMTTQTSGKMQIEAFKQGNINQRHAGTLDQRAQAQAAKMSIAQMNVLASRLNNQDTNRGRQLNTLIIANPSFAKSEAGARAINEYANQIGINPEQATEFIRLTAHGGGAPAPGGEPAPGGAPANAGFKAQAPAPGDGRSLTSQPPSHGGTPVGDKKYKTDSKGRRHEYEYRADGEYHRTGRVN